jgi:hypothetical protein
MNLAVIWLFLRSVDGFIHNAVCKEKKTEIIVLRILGVTKQNSVARPGICARMTEVWRLVTLECGVRFMLVIWVRMIPRLSLIVGIVP